MRPTMDIMNQTAYSSKEIGDPAGGKSPQSFTARLTYQLFNHRGLIYAIGATCAFAIPSICVKILQEEVGPNQLAFFRAVIILVMSLISMIHSGTSPKPSSCQELKFFVIHATFSTLAVATSFYAFQNMRAADAAAIMYAYPAFTGFLGRIFLKESFGVLEVILVSVTLLGVVLVAQPAFIFGSNPEEEPGHTGHPLTPLVALAGCFCVAMVVLSVRAMGKQDIDAVKVLFYYGLLGTILPGILATAVGQWKLSNCSSTKLITVVIGLLSYLANLLFIQALAIESAVYVAIICMNEALVVFVLEVLFLAMTPQLLSVIGMITILGSSIALTLFRFKRKAQAEFDDDSVREHSNAQTTDLS